MRIRLTMEGLAACLPQPEVSPDTMRILVPDVRERVERRAQGNMTISVCEHRPRLILPGVTWELNGEHIEISGGSGGLTIEQSFWDRVSDMKQIAPGSEEVHPDFLEDPPRRPSEEVVPLVADFMIKHGTFIVAEGDLTPPVAFLDRPRATPSTSGRFATFIQVLIDVPSNQASVSSKRYAGGSREPVTLTGGNDEELVIHFRNRCSRPDEPNLPDNDFVIYYDLSHNYNGPKRIPYTDPTSAPAGVEVNGEATSGGGCIAARSHRVGRRQ